MTAGARRDGRLADVPFQRLVAIALLVAAAVPVLILGGLVYGQVQRALATDAIERTNRALDATDATVQQAARDLAALTGSYAAWPTFEHMTASAQLDTIRTDVLQFLVERGQVTGGIVETLSGRATAGDPALTASLVSQLASPSAAPRVLSVDGGIYLVDVQDVPSDDESGAVAGRIVLAQQLDSRFAADLRRLTGFEVALVSGDGSVVVSTDPAMTGGAGSGAVPARGVVEAGDSVVTRLPIGSVPDGADPNAIAGASGAVAGDGAAIVLATRLSALQSTAGGLPVLVLGLLALIAVLATLLAVLLARVLGRRLRVVHDGLTAIADGRVPPVHGHVGGDEAGRDEVARLAAGLDRLVETLDRREATLRRCLAAAAAVPGRATPAEAAGQLAADTVEIFGLTWCRVAEADDRPIAQAGAVPDLGSGDPGADVEAVRTTDAPMGLGAAGRRLEAGLAAGAAWTDGDQDAFEVMGLLAGTVVRDAERYGRVAGRADRLDRLNRLQREVLRGISHNLRAPLATIEIAATDLADAARDDYTRSRAEAVQLEGRRLARLVNQVLILSRIESDSLELDGAPLALAPLARRMVSEMRIGDRVTVMDDSRGAVAFTDPASTEQIVWILLDNAARYSGGPIRVEVSAIGQPAVPERSLITLAVSDEGPGVAPAERRRIFGRFVRGSAARGVVGTGLGLSIARGLARAMGGDVSCVPSAVGARFEMTLPRAGGEGEGPLPEPVPASLDAGPEPAPAGAPGREVRVPVGR